MTKDELLLKEKCVVTSGVFWSVNECVAKQSHIVRVTVLSFCIRYGMLDTSLPYRHLWLTLKCPRRIMLWLDLNIRKR